MSSDLVDFKGINQERHRVAEARQTSAIIIGSRSNAYIGTPVKADHLKRHPGLRRRFAPVLQKVTWSSELTGSIRLNTKCFLQTFPVEQMINRNKKGI